MDNLEKAKKVSELLKDSDLPQAAKSVAVMGTALGASPDSVIKGMVAVTDSIDTAQAETTNPKMDQPQDYTETEKKIAEMLTENTGVNMLDSGGAYGRAWQQNRQIQDFRKQPNPIVEIHAPHYYINSESKKSLMPAEINISYDTFHYLTNFLELNDKAKELQKLFEAFAEEPDNREQGWYCLLQDFLEKLHNETEDSELMGTTNTYNYDNILHGTLQYGMIQLGNETYILLQIHGGCDVRGGYTKPQFFKVNDEDYFSLAQTDLRAGCECD